MQSTQLKPSAGEPSMSDLAPMLTAHSITRVDHDGRGVTLGWSDGRHSRFPALWLRDNCPCAQCRHPQALERTFMFIDHGRPRITSASITDDGALEVRFLAGDMEHVSRYAKGWLRTHDCSPEALAERRLQLQLWDGVINDTLPIVDYMDYMTTDAGLRAWIEAIQVHGIVLMRGVPAQAGQLVDVTRRIGPVRGTNFGEYYDVVSLPNPNASAYTSLGLELHTDLANWHSPPDVQLLFCIKSSVQGGESLFADGFRVAEDLRVKDPAAFALLSSHPMEFRFHDGSCDIRTSAPPIALDRDGRITRVRFNNWLRAPTVLPEHLVEPMYAALETFWRMLRDPGYHLNLRLEPGCLIAYDNNRVLHGRASFDPTTGERHLQGCYLNLDDLQSTLRLLDRAVSLHQDQREPATWVLEQPGTRT
jgi:gamma-butyrobetaine hydroxylase